MDSLRDQLAKLYPELGKDEPKKLSPGPAKAASSMRTPETPKEVGSWKDGVTPLPHSGRIESKKPGPVLQYAIPKRNLLQPGSKKDLYKAPVTARPHLPLQSTIGNAGNSQVQSPEPKSRSDGVPRRTVFGNVRGPTLTREAEFKEPEGWVAAGAALQPPKSSGGRNMTVRVGIDFGTAYTKVAIRAGDQLFFVPWTATRNHDAVHYLPGEISISPDGAVWLGRMANAVEVRGDLKLPFLERNIGSREQFGAAIAYLAWVMRYSRAWFYRTQGALIENRRLTWEVNLGCPTDSWSAPDMRFSYETLGIFAWKLSQTSRDIGWEFAVSVAAGGRPSLESVGLDALNSMPEFVAQIAGYVRSPQRKDGLHLLMDVGAGTVDLAMFNVGNDQMEDGDRYDIFVSKVLPLGTHFLMAERNRRLNLATAWDDFQAVPSAEQFAALAGVPEELVTASDVEFGGVLTQEIKWMLDHTHAKRYGKAPEWRSGLPTFLCGGGSDCELYADCLTEAFKRHQVSMKRTPFPLLEEASRSTGGGANDFHRLSVAYGLTFDAESVGRILTPQQIEDAPRVDLTVDKPKERPDRDDLYY
jgi:hypothetical protein